MPIILASQSAARRAMLVAAGVSFVAVASQADEAAEKQKLLANHVQPPEIALALAKLKARDVAVGREDHLILGSDQILSLKDGTMLDKPNSPHELKRHLRLLSGSTHQLHSAAAIIERDECVWEIIETVSMVMRPLSDAFIDQYVASAAPDLLGCVGGYQIEGVGVQLFQRIEGSYHAVLGLPLLPLLNYLAHRGVLLQ
jgi:septum formation protein